MKSITLTLGALLLAILSSASTLLAQQVVFSNTPSSSDLSISGNQPSSMKAFGGTADELAAKAKAGQVLNSRGNPAFVDLERRAKNGIFGEETTVVYTTDNKFTREENVYEASPYSKNPEGDYILQGAFGGKAFNEELEDITIKFTGPASFAENGSTNLTQNFAGARSFTNFSSNGPVSFTNSSIVSGVTNSTISNYTAASTNYILNIPNADYRTNLTVGFVNTVTEQRVNSVVVANVTNISVSNSPGFTQTTTNILYAGSPWTSNVSFQTTFFTNLQRFANVPYNLRLLGYEKSFEVNDPRLVRRIELEVGLKQALSLVNWIFIVAPDGRTFEVAAPALANAGFFSDDTTGRDYVDFAGTIIISVNGQNVANSQLITASSNQRFKTLTRLERLQRLKTGVELTNPLERLSRSTFRPTAGSQNPVSGLFLSEENLDELSVPANGTWRLRIVSFRDIGVASSQENLSVIDFFKVTLKVPTSKKNLRSRDNFRF